MAVYYKNLNKTIENEKYRIRLTNYKKFHDLKFTIY